MLFSLIIFGGMAMLLTGIGISQIKSNVPVGFYTYGDIPEANELTDMRAWNKKHGTMWVLYSVAILLAWCLWYFLGGVPGIVAMCAGMLVPLPLMMLYHKKLVKTYWKK